MDRSYSTSLRERGRCPNNLQAYFQHAQMHEELFQYERAAGRLLLLPITEKDSRFLDGCRREKAPQELNGTFAPEDDDVEMEFF